MMETKAKSISQALENLEKLADHAGSDFKAKLQDELEHLQSKFKDWKPQLDELKAKAQDQAKKAKESAEEQIHKNPWAAIGIVGLIFFVLGFLLAHRSGRRD